jgi:tetratricopeptide (TPR) repeat protein
MPTSKPIRSLLYLLFGVCPILFFTDLTRNPYYTQIALLNMWVPACWCLWLWEAWRAQELVWVSSAFDTGLLALIGVSVVSWLLSMWVHPNLIKPIYSEGSKAAVFLIVNTFLVYAAALRAREPALLRRLLWITYAVSFIASMYGVLQYFGIELVWPSHLNPYGSRPVSTFGNPNFMSSFLVVAIPAMVMDFVYDTTGCPKAILFIVIHMSLAALLATLTRSSWVGLAMGLAVVFWGTRRDNTGTFRGKLILGVTMLALALAWPQSGGGGGYSATVIQRLMEVKRASTEAYGSAYQRFLIWLSAWGMVLDHPFLGKGWGCFELFYPFYQGPLLMLKNLSARTHANNCHNEILEYWSQIGSIGLGIVAWMWILFFTLGASIVRRLAGSTKFLFWGFLGGATGMLVDNLLNVSIHFCIPAFLFWWWVGSAMALDPAALTIRRIDLHAGWRKGLVAACIIGLLCLVARAFALWMGEINFFKGFKLSKGGVDLVSATRYLGRAYEWHHLEVNNNYELGNVYARLGERDQALFMYQRAIDANSGYDEIFFNRATMLMQMGRYEEAIANYRTCLAINPLSEQAYNAIGSLYFKDIARYANDIESLYVQGVRVFPDDRDMWNNLGYIYTQRQNWPKAIDAYQHAVQIDPNFDLARRNLAVVMQKAGLSTGVLKH